MSEDQLVSGKSPIQDAALALMRKPFAEHQISKMCKSTKKDNPPGRCNDCKGWHKLPSVQLSYVGHAALTDRLLDADPTWTWEPVTYAADGTPLIDANGGLWIKLTVAGVTRLGYGDAQGKVGGDAMKERIGDALRNAGMRFGAALDLWHKGDLHPAIEVEEPVATFEKKGEAFVRKTDIPATNGQNAPSVPQPPVIVKLPEPAKPVARKKKESVPDAGKPWGGEFEPKTATTPGSPVQESPASISNGQPGISGQANIHGLVIEDSEVPFPGDPEPNVEPKPAHPVSSKPEGISTRLATDAERKEFMGRLIKLKEAGYTGIREWLLKESGVQITNDIPFLKMTELVAHLEAAEKAGTLKALLG